MNTKPLQLLSITLILILIAFQAVAQWVWQNPKPQGNTLNSVCYITPETGFAVGEFGTIIKTINGGKDWIKNTTNY
jgi:photosystem II stability/assembly factor-like uncharacterized protein